MKKIHQITCCDRHNYIDYLRSFPEVSRVRNTSALDYIEHLAPGENPYLPISVEPATGNDFR